MTLRQIWSWAWDLKWSSDYRIKAMHERQLAVATARTEQLQAALDETVAILSILHYRSTVMTGEARAMTSEESHALALDLQRFKSILNPDIAHGAGIREVT